MLIDFNADATGEALASRAEVSATRQMTVEEIIARHRQQQAAQDAAVDHYDAHARMEQHFRPTLTDPATTSSRKTATSRRPTASSGKSCRSR